MKRAWVLEVVVVALLILSACGGEESDGESDADDGGAGGSTSASSSGGSGTGGEAGGPACSPPCVRPQVCCQGGAQDYTYCTEVGPDGCPLVP